MAQQPPVFVPSLFAGRFVGRFRHRLPSFLLSCLVQQLLVPLPFSSFPPSFHCLPPPVIVPSPIACYHSSIDSITLQWSFSFRYPFLSCCIQQLLDKKRKQYRKKVLSIVFFFFFFFFFFLFFFFVHAIVFEY